MALIAFFQENRYAVVDACYPKSVRKCHFHPISMVNFY